MKKIKNTFGENLELIEIAKLKTKYEELGFDFKSKMRIRINHNDRIDIDAYAKHPITGEEIIFEVKAQSSVKKGDNERLIERRKQILSKFPRAKFVLVLAKEPEKQSVEISSLTNLLLKFISDNKLKELSSLIRDIKDYEVQSLNIQKIDFKDFKTIDLNGYGNFVFKHYVNDNKFEGFTISDGIPFNFNLKLINNFNSQNPFTLSLDSIVSFDLSEFEKD